MMDAARRVLGISRRARLHIPGGKPTYVVHRRGEDWGVAVLHGGREIHWYAPDEARREAVNLIRLAELASQPGSVPREAFG